MRLAGSPAATPLRGAWGSARPEAAALLPGLCRSCGWPPHRTTLCAPSPVSPLAPQPLRATTSPAGPTRPKPGSV